MTVLWVTLVIVFILSLFSRLFTVRNLTIGYPIIRPNKFLVFFALTCIVMVSGLRNTIGDTYYYMHAYESIDFTWDYTLENKDPGFSVLQMVLKNFSTDAQLLIFVTALVTNVLIFITLYKYTKVFELGIYVYITSGMFIVSMNGIRQFLAASIIFWGTKYLINGNLISYLLLVLLASTFHESALILIPIYFIVRREAWTKFTFILLVLTSLLVLGFEQFSTLLFSAIEETQYGHYNDFSEGGANRIRVVVEAIPVIIAFLGRHKLKELWPKSDIIVNMSLISLIFMLIATQNWIFARFNIYFSLYNIILISWLVYLFKESNRKFIYYGILVCYLMYFYYEQVITLNLNYRSDYFNL